MIKIMMWALENISQRLEDHQFIISGTQTGHLERLSPNEYTT